jgi:hypothetical protein
VSATRYEFDRRSFLRLVAVVAATAGLGTTGTAVTSAKPAEVSGGTDVAVARRGVLPEPRRYQFRCTTSRGVRTDLARLEAVWAHPDYTRMRKVVVTFDGPGPFVLSPQEAAIIEVAEKAGAVVGDPPGYYLAVLTACTRIPPERLTGTLAGLGVPGVAAAVRLAPFAPQAAQLERWLGRETG